MASRAQESAIASFNATESDGRVSAALKESQESAMLAARNIAGPKQPERAAKIDEPQPTLQRRLMAPWIAVNPIPPWGLFLA
jgi:hypothetical protein